MSDQAAVGPRTNKAGLLAALVTEDAVGKVTAGIDKTIAESFAADGSKPTTWEVKRRFEFCIDIFLELRGDLKWGYHRILAALPRYLRVRLDGGKYNPEEDARRGMFPDEGDPLAEAGSSDSPDLLVPAGPRIILP